MSNGLKFSAMWAIFALLAGCAQQQPPATTEAAADSAAYQLTSPPAGAQGVIAARETVKDDDEVAIEGRIGGDPKPWVEGAAAFTIVDTSLKPCEDGCETPWDYCCDLDVLPKAKAMVKVVDANGRTVDTDARRLLGVKELSTVVVHGKAKRDDAGNLTVLADGVFVKPQE